jgi:hypothetical protein
LRVSRQKLTKGVDFTDQAKADIRAIPQPIAIQILRTLARFLESAEGNIKRLQASSRRFAASALRTIASSSAITANTSRSLVSVIARKLTASFELYDASRRILSPEALQPVQI